MTGNPENRHHLIGWGGSLFVHAVVLIWGFFLLIRPARLNVEAGKSSTETVMTLELSPPVIAPIAPPQQKIQPTPRPETHPLSAQPVLKSEPSRPAHPPTPQNNVPAETSYRAKGVAEAQPDDLHNEPPVYPEESRMAREQGVVILQVEVTAMGEPGAISIVKSSGYFRLDQAARRAVQHWKFHPATAGGVPVPSKVDTPVRFKLQ